MIENALILEKMATILDGNKVHNSDWELTRCILASYVKQTRRDRELKEKENEPLMFKARFF